MKTEPYSEELGALLKMKELFIDLHKADMERSREVIRILDEKIKELEAKL